MSARGQWDAIRRYARNILVMVLNQCSVQAKLSQCQSARDLFHTVTISQGWLQHLATPDTESFRDVEAVSNSKDPSEGKKAHSSLFFLSHFCTAQKPYELDKRFSSQNMPGGNLDTVNVLRHQRCTIVTWWNNGRYLNDRYPRYISWGLKAEWPRITDPGLFVDIDKS